MTDPLLPDGTRIDRLATGGIWTEGPLWIAADRTVRWSDIPNDRILQWSAATGETSVHRQGVEFTNGRAVDIDGSVIQCSHGHRRLEREWPDGTVEAIVSHWNDARLNSPNDVAIAPDGSYWFTDPDYGIVQPNEGHPGAREYGGRFVFRWSPADGLTPVITDIDQPNGIAFSPDGRTVYVTDTAAGLDDGPGHWIRAYDVTGPAVHASTGPAVHASTGPAVHASTGPAVHASTGPAEHASTGPAVHASTGPAEHASTGAARGRTFAVIEVGLPDGIAVDEHGRVWCSAGDGVHVFEPDGTEIRFIPVPEVVSNVCFGGDDGTDLFLTATTSLYRLRTSTRAASRPTGSAN